MKEFDDLGLKLSIQQADIFSEMNKLFSGSSYSIIKAFMNSNAAFRIDMDGIIDSSNIIYELSNNRLVYKGNVKIDPDIIYWIGYIYRYWVYVFEENSKNVYSIIQSKELEKLFGPYHTLDPKVAIERILENKNIKQKDSLMDIVRKVYLV